MKSIINNLKGQLLYISIKYIPLFLTFVVCGLLNHFIFKISPLMFTTLFFSITIWSNTWDIKNEKYTNLIINGKKFTKSFKIIK